MDFNIYCFSRSSESFVARHFLKLLFAVAVGVTSTPAAQAAIILYNLPTPLTAAPGDNMKQIGNISLSGTYDYSSTAPHFLFYSDNDFMSGGPYVWMAGDNSLSLAKDGSGYIAKIDATTPIDGSWAAWTAGFHNPTLTSSGSGPWTGGATDYVGLRISDSGNYYYGWASATYNAASISLTISNFAFQGTPNLAINAGDTGIVAVPEPASGVLILAGAFAAASCHRRRRATHATD